MTPKSRMLAAFALVVMVSCAVGGPGGESAISTTQEEVGFIITCVHYWPSLLECPKTPGLVPETNIVPIRDVDSVQYGLFVRGSWVRKSFPVNRVETANNIDAVFFTRDVINKFAIPWYVSEGVSLDELKEIVNMIPSPSDTL